MLDFAKPVHPFVSETTTVTSPPRPPKRRRQSNAAIATQAAAPLPALKRQRVDDVVDEKSPKRAKVAAVAPVVPPPTAAPVATPTRAGEGNGSAQPLPPQQQQSLPSRPQAAVVAAPDLERAQETIEHEFSVAILHKHNELRLINQELAKCQVALEQLRRCHLIPYPVNVPTPEQMLNISNGTGPALQSKPGEKVPEWAPPFGVTDGPYARHYAKWLIPDPKFDGIVPDAPLHAESARGRKGVESRSTRNSIGDVGGFPGKGRPSRGMASQKLHALPNGYAQPKDKAGPCILKRADGKTVKLVCIDCKRDNFSSTQGFINHCRIAHKRDFKSHEEAAVACGHPIEVDVNAGGGDEKAATASASSSSNAATTPAAIAVGHSHSGHSHSSSVGGSTSLAPGLVHPFARGNALSESEACFSVVSRIKESMDMYRKGQMQGFSSIPGVSSTPPPAMKARKDSDFSPSVDSPHLSRLLESRGKTMNLGELVRDAKTKVNLDDVMSPDGESDDGDSAPDSLPADPPRMRVPARTTAKSPVPPPSVTRPASSKGRGHTVPYVTPVPTPASRPASEQEAELPPMADEMDLDLSPNTAVSINAPSLVSDDGEYDDSVDGSSDESEANDGLDAESMSDVAEIGFDDDHMRSLRHHRGSTTGDSAVRFRKEDNKHVTFVGTVKENGSQKQRNRPVK